MSAPNGRKTYRGAHGRLPLPLGPLLGYLLKTLAVVVIALASLDAMNNRTTTADALVRSREVLRHTQKVLSTLTDAETAQRGYLLTGDERYLAPYANAPGTLATEWLELNRLVSDDMQRQKLALVRELAREKFSEIDRTIDLRRRGNLPAALGIVGTDRGRMLMERIRSLVAEVEGIEQNTMQVSYKNWRDAIVSSSAVIWTGCGILLVLIGGFALLASRGFRQQETITWLRVGRAGLGARILGIQQIDQLGDGVLEYLASYLDARAGALYILQDGQHLRRVAGYALSGEHGDDIGPGEGLLGQVVKERRPIRVRDVPPDYLVVNSATGRSPARELLLAPVAADGVMLGAIELGFFRRLQAWDETLMDDIADLVGVALRTALDRDRMEQLLAETQRQAEELQTQQEELRVSNEELEEQGRALKESHVRLEAQQGELEHINSQLEHQTQLLEIQRDDLTAAQRILREKAAELERSNQYKSEFLANMSHELRTPLNSTLILAKLLADNKAGNLTPEQVKYANTISSAGNDLLVLINEILDLSKIEAGKMEVVPERVLLRAAIDAATKPFEQLAREKGLKLSATIEQGTPPEIDTDPVRLGQILRNLLSNAIKFTSEGSVALTVFSSPERMVCFSVRDSGIGIPARQQQIIFDAFRQADGSTHRKYGGTGLGLSISRDLARLLGGDIAVQSTPGEGSIFTLRLPLTYSAPDFTARPLNPITEPVTAARIPTMSESRPAATVEDDRQRLDPATRVILVIEDDERFAAILRDLSHEMGFQCVVAPTASEGIAAATRYKPSAILLDINLPDYSGLGVLDHLKHHAATRHIPVHITSVVDYTQEAMQRGAVGYALKPVKREHLIDVFQRLEAKFTQDLRRVLVVEDDEHLRESIHDLLSMDDVQIVTVPNAGDAMDALQRDTFDCMVIDLTLPDMSGFELLERISAREQLPFPPVIVYTGRVLSADEEQRLRRFSRSIIVKDARSPERLLDEVTLFLHQVEAELPPERQRMLKIARDRDATLDGRRILVVEDDVRNIFALASVLEPRGASVTIARNGKEALRALHAADQAGTAIDIVLMDIMMPEMDGLTAMREIRKEARWKKLPVIALTAKAMKDDQEKCVAAGASDYIAKPLDVERLFSLLRVWMPKDV